MKKLALIFSALTFVAFANVQAQSTESGESGEEWQEFDELESAPVAEASPAITASATTDGLLTIWYENLVGNTATVSIMDRNGRMVQSAQVEKRDANGWVNMGIASLTAGLYIIQIESGSYKAVTKAILR